MKKITKRAICAFLIAAMLAASACSDDGEKKAPVQTTAAPVTTIGETDEEKILPELPEITFDGRDYRFYQYEISAQSVPMFSDIWVESESAEPVESAVYRRNSMIEEKYEIKINFTTDEQTDYDEKVKRYTRANEDYAEALISMGHNVWHIHTSDVFYNLHDIPYLDFERPWWDRDAAECFTLSGYMPFTVSDLTINDKGVTAAVYFNKKLAEDYNVTIDFYSLVEEGKWTMDEMIKAGSMVSDDINGDTKMDDSDRYGIVTKDDAVYQLFHSAGGRYISKDDEGAPYFSFESEYNYTVIAYYLENIMFDPKLTRNNSYVHNSLNQLQMFERNQGLFMFGTLGDSQVLREMEADFGIIPIPKYDASQPGYSSSVSVLYGSLISVPKIAKETEFIGIILEAMSAESKYTLIPAFYETVLKDKTMRDEQSVRMLDIIIDGMVFDPGDYYNIANFPDYFLRITGSVYNNLGDKNFPQRTSDIASFYAMHEKKISKAMDKLIKIIEEWKEN